MKKLSVVLSFVMSLVILGSCAQNTEKSSLVLTLDEYPKADGSTVTIPLAEEVAAKVLGMTIEEVRPYIAHNKTHPAYINLIEKRADVIFVTYPSDEELEIAETANVELEIIPIVSEAFVFIVNANNPIDSLTLQQVKDIYAGKITNWKELGGEDKQIIAYQRPENSGSQTGMYQLVLPKNEMMEAPLDKIIGEMGAVIDAVAVYNNETDAIGYSYYYFTTDMWNNDQVKLLAIDGVLPTKETIQNGTYPITTAYYAVLRKDEPSDSNARKLVEWIISEEGQDIVEKAGYIKLK